MTFFEASQLAVREHPFGVLFILWFLLLGLGQLINVYLSFKLNPLFDPKLKKYTERFTSWVPTLTDRFLRSGLYANWVARKEWFGRNRPEVQAVDFRTGVSKATVFWCWVYSLIGYTYALGLVLFVAMLAMGLTKKS